MMKKWKSALQYFLMLAATVFLVWFSFNSLTVPDSNNTWADKINFLQKTWQQAEMQWLWLMAGFAMVSHLLRAQRWKMLLTASGNPVNLFSSFLSLMIGYLVNLVVPRGGEVSRCLNLLKLHKTPVETSLGTVVVERLADVLFLLLIIALAFFMQADMLINFIETLPLDTSGSFQKIFILIILGLSGALILYLLFRWLKTRPSLYAKWKKLLGGFQDGLQSVIKLKSKGWFLFHSIAIWALYFVMTYCVLQAFDSTQNLGTGAILSVFALGSIAMALPLPGGAGAYHTLVPAGITFLYQIPSSDAIAFVFIFYAWQTLIMIVGGALSMLISSFIAASKSK